MRKPEPFYVSGEWRKLRKKVLAKHKYECQECKHRGKYTKATYIMSSMEDYGNMDDGIC